VTRRDRGVVRQQWDYSCGLAALATLLTHDYQAPVSEAALLEALQDRSPQDGAALRQTGVSLADLAWLARRRGFRAAGLALQPSALARLERPAIVYLEQQGMPHFVVLRGLTADGAAFIADPSYGNRYMKAERFLRQFLPGGEGGGEGRGRLLLLHSPGQGAMMRVSTGTGRASVRLRPPWTRLPPGPLLP
jgi:predicted double-glycine peptidase